MLKKISELILKAVKLGCCLNLEQSKTKVPSNLMGELDEKHTNKYDFKILDLLQVAGLWSLW